MAERLILGIWDGHDAGAALVTGEGRILSAVNEERLSRKKLDIGFPTRSINSCLSIAGVLGSEITDVSFTTTDFAKTLSRVFPGIGRNYYNFRRRKVERPPFVGLRRAVKFAATRITEPSSIYRALSESQMRSLLKAHGITGAKLHVVDHHTAHAAGAYYCSGFDGLVITLDGVGDGLSGSVNLCEDGIIKRISKISARDSLGTFYEQVTTILGMRELEDEGKVMSLADYSHKTENKLLNLFSVDGLGIRAKFSPEKQYRILERLAWRIPPEDFSRMAQETLEKHALSLFENSARETGAKKIAWSGGVMSNIKLNMEIRRRVAPKDWFVFPHMGDGGLALGAALFVAGVPMKRKLSQVYFGPENTKEEILSTLRSSKADFSFREVRDCEGLAADVMEDEETYVFRFYGRMEYGPRALGNRTIAAPAHSLLVKNKLNLRIKERNWYQPFCPSILETEARRIFSDYDRIPDKFMTMGYYCKPGMVDRMQAALHIDETGRPQMVGKENPQYSRFLSKVKKRTGLGAILNTSFNFHGDPIVCTIADALDMMKRTGTRHMFSDGLHIELKKGR